MKKQKLIVYTVALSAGAALLVPATWAEHKKAKGDKETCSFQQSTKITGDAVQDAQGQTIGKIHDLILAPSSGRIAFGLVSLNLPEHNGKLTAVPWQLFRMKDENTYMLNVDRDKLLTARMWDSSATIDFTAPDFARQTYTHYGLTWDDRMAVGGHVTMPGGVETGVYYDDEEAPKFPRPQPDGKSTFPDLNPEDKDR